jgi:VIT1/CCC1 family predicted Fe2+/Mn2+ transporter
MSNALTSGIHFGLTSGVITTLGLMVGLYSGTHSELAVIGGIITIAVADAMSDALGIHMAKEAENQHNHRDIWIATIATFVAKFLMSALFLIPVLLLPLSQAVFTSIFMGLVVQTVLSYQIASSRGESVIHGIIEHVGIAIAVVIASYFIGVWVAKVFG